MNVLYADGGGEERRRTGGGSSSGSLERDGRAASTIHATTTRRPRRGARWSRKSPACASRTARGASPSARTPRSPRVSSSSAPRTDAACAPRGAPVPRPGYGPRREGRRIPRRGRRPLPRPPRDHPGVALGGRRGVRRVDEDRLAPKARARGAWRSQARAGTPTSVNAPSRRVVERVGHPVGHRSRSRAGGCARRTVRCETCARRVAKSATGQNHFAKPATRDAPVPRRGVRLERPTDVNAQLTRTEPAWCGWCGELCAHLVRDKARAKCQCLVCGGGTAPCERCPGRCERGTAVGFDDSSQ